MALSVALLATRCFRSQVPSSLAPHPSPQTCTEDSKALLVGNDGWPWCMMDGLMAMVRDELMIWIMNDNEINNNVSSVSQLCFIDG